MKRQLDQELIYVGISAIIIYSLFLLFGQSNVEIPLPTYTQTEALSQIESEAKQIGIQPIAEAEIYYTDIVAHSSVSRYIEQHELSDKALQRIQNEVPLAVFEVASIDRTYAYDMQKKRFTFVDHISLKENPDEFVKRYYGEEFTLMEQTLYDGDDISQRWQKKYSYIAETAFPDLRNVVNVYVEGNFIVSFEQYGFASNFPQPEVSLLQIVVSIVVLLFLVGLVIFVTIHLIIKVVKKEIEAFWEPLLLTLFAAIGWLFLSKALGSNLQGVGIIEQFMMIYLTFATLLIRWKRDQRPMLLRLQTLQPAVIHGFLLMFIAQLLAEVFFYVASYFDTWVSPVTMHMVLVQLDLWLIPIFTLFIGVSAAITEEAIFRRYMIPLFSRFGALTSMILTSFLWGILHIGYDMYPWYLYVLEFVLITGPLFYLVYKRYGFSTSMFLHYFYNSWVTTLFLFSVDVLVAFVSLLVMLSPFLLFIIRKKHRREQLDLSLS